MFLLALALYFPSLFQVVKLMSKENLLLEEEINRFSSLEKKKKRHLNGDVLQEYKPHFPYQEKCMEKSQMLFCITIFKVCSNFGGNLDFKQSKCKPFCLFLLPK